MDEKQMEELRQRHAAGMRAMSEEDLNARARAQLDGMRNAPMGGDHMRGQAQHFNMWPQMLADEKLADEMLRKPPAPTRMQRFRAWLARYRWW